MYLRTPTGGLEVMERKEDPDHNVAGYRLMEMQQYLFQCTVCLRATKREHDIVKCVEGHRQAADLAEKVLCPEC